MRLLGPVELHGVDRPVPAGSPQQTTVLAVLAADAGRSVTVDALLERVWDADPPPGARRTLHTYVARLRRLLERAGGGERPAGGEPATLVRHGGGYLLALDPGQVDLHRFRRLVEEAGQPVRTDEQRVTLLRAALRLWRGEPLAGLPGEWAARSRANWSQQRLDAAVAWAAAESSVGNPSAAIGPLRDLLADFPLVEPLAAVLMRTLHAAGRGAEALDTYLATRRRLVDEVGLEPGVELQATQQAILRDVPAGPASSTRAGRPVQLPADPHAFTGRQAELSELDEALSTVDSRLVVVSGTAGVGKTALAVRWAHRVSRRFPDGQLYLDLRGYDPKRPTPAGDALARLLAGLGVAGRDIPLDEEERAARYRTEVDGLRLLIVLDNAGSAEQVRPLLPGTPSCLVLVTSRDSLAGLVALHGARRLNLDLLPRGDAVALLRRLVGARVDAEPDAAATLAARCAWLPLALRIAAERAVARPAASLVDLVADLDDLQRRLAVLTAGGDPRATVSVVFSWSYRHLDAATALAFRRAGLHPGPDLEPHALAALVGTGVGTARQALARLDRAHLTQLTGPDRHGMHDLLRAYAVGLAADDGDAGRHALTRLFDFYLAAAATAMDLLYPAERHHRPRVAPTSGGATPAVPELGDPARALSWLDTELPTLVAVCRHGADAGWPGHASRLAATLFRYLDGGHFAEGVSIHGDALRAARASGDQRGQAHALLALGGIHRRTGRSVPAAGMHREALALFHAAGDRIGAARALTNLGLIDWTEHRLEPAVDHLHAATEGFRAAADRVGEARALTTLGLVELRRGCHQAAAGHHRNAARLFAELGDRAGEAHALDNLGYACRKLAQYEQAAEHHRQAQVRYHELGDQHGEATATDNLGNVHTLLGRSDEAIRHHRQALAAFQRLGDRSAESNALNGLGEALRAAGRPAAALTAHAAALTAATAAASAEQQARAHAGLADAHQLAGDVDRSREHWQLARDGYLGIDEDAAAAADARLTAASGGSPEPPRQSD